MKIYLEIEEKKESAEETSEEMDFIRLELTDDIIDKWDTLNEIEEYLNKNKKYDVWLHYCRHDEIASCRRVFVKTLGKDL